MKISLKKINKNDLEDFWNVAYKDKNAAWTKFNGPYFKDKLPAKEDFVNGEASKKHLNNNMYKAIWCDGEIVGSVSAYYEDKNLKRWLDVGICIYDKSNWHKGIGKIALKKWIDEIFVLVDLPHVGLTTWSGNQSMMHLATKIGLNKEAEIPKVRYWEDKYWNSVKYGILRNDWNNLKGERRI
ncbi:N-acetyltransferase [Apilactobacillus micheneri]|uniref:N-acetyltransferase n=1 Tax=Apilactobacillus micheneri TaxID=1899430 RepID=A0ABY2YYN9_9LACO|nr:GNAT family protein [Apilactobacillus micheneri]TPR26391.1 N-acetyltransferase [Apilactobacillus micheneri]TPR27145.1 N-acetyltransferase [Apilactobacillus micheneri]TPR27392.1 N-acetyltransferase [Apilactobacillus micheneri]TPR31908.1 N-acetyltransferase [Apilactobacillus micheneri]TPR32312.1 N-acetyltransferase [Apilactobacillus micheneri]